MKIKRRALSILVCVFVGASLLAGGSNGELRRTDRTRPLPAELAVTATRSDNDPWTPPGLPRILDGENPSAGVFRDVMQTVVKQKLQIQLPDLVTLNYVTQCIQSPFLGRVTLRRANLGRPHFTPGCRTHLNKRVDYAMSLFRPEDAPAGVRGAFAKSWVQSPPGAAQPFGVFTPVTVHALAFGSVPVTATVHIRQAKVDGMVQPIRLETFVWMGFKPNACPQTRTLLEQFGCRPGGENSAYMFFPPTTMSGPIEITLSDVKVDGVPLPAGSQCTASGRIILQPTPGWYSKRYEEHPIEKGEPGEFTLFTPGWNHGTVNIGDFNGCGQGGKNLDPLMTSMISGDGNPVDMTIANAIAFQQWCTPITIQETGEVVQGGNTWCKLPDAPAIDKDTAPQSADAKARTRLAENQEKQVMTPTELVDVLEQSTHTDLPADQRKALIESFKRFPMLPGHTA